MSASAQVPATSAAEHRRMLTRVAFAATIGTTIVIAHVPSPAERSRHRGDQQAA